MQLYGKHAKKTREIFDWTGAQADYRQYAKDLKVKEVLNFREQHHVVLSPFCFWLLQDQDPLGCGEIIAPPFNHRRPDQTVFEEDGVDNLLTGSSEANHQYLQNGVIVSMPYCLAPASKVLKEAVLSLRSTVTFSWNTAEDPKFHFGINVPNVTVKKPDIDVYWGLAGFFGYHYQPIDQTIKAYDDVVDLPLLMNRFGAEDMTTVSHLNAVLGKMGFHFRYKEKTSEGDTTTVQAFRHFAAFFRMITPFRLAQLEGTHRTYLLNRAMLGFGSRDPVPLRVEDGRAIDFPSAGTLVDDMTLRLVYTYDDKTRQGRYTLTKIDRAIVQDDIEWCNTYSYDTQTFRTLTYHDDFRQLLRNTMEKIADDPLYGYSGLSNDRDFWSLGQECFFGHKDNTVFGMYLSKMLGILITGLYNWVGVSGKVKDENKINKMKNEAEEQFVPDLARCNRLFAKKVLTAPMAVKIENIGSKAYYTMGMETTKKQHNQSFRELWVAVWLVKTSLVSTKCFSMLHDFLGKPKVQHLLSVQWLNDSVITPIDNIVRHYFEIRDKGIRTAKPRHKLVNYFKARFLMVFIAELSKIDYDKYAFLDVEEEEATAADIKKKTMVVTRKKNYDLMVRSY